MKLRFSGQVGSILGFAIVWCLCFLFFAGFNAFFLVVASYLLYLPSEEFSAAVRQGVLFGGAFGATGLLCLLWLRSSEGEQR